MIVHVLVLLVYASRCSERECSSDWISSLNGAVGELLDSSVLEVLLLGMMLLLSRLVDAVEVAVEVAVALWLLLLWLGSLLLTLLLSC